jgi:hypothetical protein
MLRRTNINRASLRRAYGSVSDATTKETFEQKHNKNYSTNAEYNTRSCTTTSNGTNGSKHITPTSSLSRSDSKESWDENEYQSIKNTKNSQNDSEQQERYKSMTHWNNSENNSDSKKSWTENEQLNRSDLKLKNEQQGKANSKVSWIENEQRSRCDLKKSQAENEQQRKGSSNNSLHKNELCQPEIKKSQSINKEYGRTDFKEFLSETCKTRTEMTTELVPGLIIQGHVTEL